MGGKGASRLSRMYQDLGIDFWRGSTASLRIVVVCLIKNISQQGSKIAVSRAR